MRTALTTGGSRAGTTPPDRTNPAIPVAARQQRAQLAGHQRRQIETTKVTPRVTIAYRTFAPAPLSALLALLRSC